MNVFYQSGLRPYPYWQLLLVDDGSTNPGTLKTLDSPVAQDPRIEVFYCKMPQGISAATNRGIDKATGDYIIFLDHDDRLAPDALHYIARQIKQTPDVDIIYSDRDMISPNNNRFMYLFKPGWSPETLLSGNYIFHLLCYSRTLLNKLGGLRSEFDGSQDYDLILRAAETDPIVRHIDRVLYHWRQHEYSVAMNDHAKDYAFEAGKAALNSALTRRGISGSVTEIADLWRGMHSVKLPSVNDQDIELIVLNSNTPCSYRRDLYKQLQDNRNEPYIAILGDKVTPLSNDTLQSLSAWLTLKQIGLVSGKLINKQGNIDYCGMHYQADGSLCAPYRGFPETEAGYMAITRILRNISAPHPYCVIINRELWRQLGGFNPAFEGPYALMDFALRALNSGWRCLVDPQYRFEVSENLLDGWPKHDHDRFTALWKNWLENGDPYFNKNLIYRSGQLKLNNSCWIHGI